MFEQLLQQIKWKLTAAATIISVIFAVDLALIYKTDNDSFTILLISFPIIIACIIFIILSLLNAFKDLNHWYVQILDFIYLPMSITDMDMNWTFINEPVNDIIGFTRKEALGKHCSNWGADICNTDRCGICMLRHKQGTSFFTNEGVDKSFQVDTTYLYNRKGAKIGHFELVSDITAKVRLDDAIKQLKQYSGEEFIPIKHNVLPDREGVDNSNMRQYTIQEDSISTEELYNLTMKANVANKAKSDFLANMSHEIRTPMNAILGFTEILKGKITDPKSSRYLDTILTSGKALLSLINDILDLSKVEAGEMKLEYSALSIKDLFNEIKVVFGQKVDEKGVELVVDIPGNTPASILLDKSRLRQILINLIGNAFKFTDSGYIKLSVNFSYPEEAATNSAVDIVITLEDSGVGIPEDHCESIFDAFSQVSGQKTTKYGGTGLGLSITKRLVEMMGGQISVSSTVGKGSTFTIKLDKVEVVTVDNMTSSTYQQHDIDSVHFEGSTVLITDDIEFNRELIIGYLDGYNINLIEAENGKQAVEISRELHPDLIIMDMKMPVMTGYEASEIIRNDDKLNDIKVIALTASAMKEDELVIKKLCDSYLRKPVCKTDLIIELIKFLPHQLVESSGSETAEPEIEHALVLPPDEQIAILHNMAMSGNLNAIIKQADQLVETNPECTDFAHKLSEFALSFQDEQLVRFIEKYLGTQNE